MNKLFVCLCIIAISGCCKQQTYECPATSHRDYFSNDRFEEQVFTNQTDTVVFSLTEYKDSPEAVRDCGTCYNSYDCTYTNNCSVYRSTGPTQGGIGSFSDYIGVINNDTIVYLFESAGSNYNRLQFRIGDASVGYKTNPVDLSSEGLSLQAVVSTAYGSYDNVIVSEIAEPGNFNNIAFNKTHQLIRFDYRQDSLWTTYSLLP